MNGAVIMALALACWVAVITVVISGPVAVGAVLVAAPVLLMTSTTKKGGHE